MISSSQKQKKNQNNTTNILSHLTLCKSTEVEKNESRIKKTEQSRLKTGSPLFFQRMEGTSSCPIRPLDKWDLRLSYALGSGLKSVLVGVMFVYVGWGLDGNREEREIYRVSFT